MSSFPFADAATAADRMSEKTANPLEQFVLLAKTAKVTSFASFKVLFIKKSCRAQLLLSWSNRPWRPRVSLSLGSCLICQMFRLALLSTFQSPVSCTHETFSLFRTWKMDPTLPTWLSSTLLLMETTDPWWTTRQTFPSWLRWWWESCACSPW